MSKYKYPSKRINGVKKRLHRHVMEQHLGRALTFDEHIYHLNGDPQDYAIENLVLIKKKFRKQIATNDEK